MGANDELRDEARRDGRVGVAQARGFLVFLAAGGYFHFVLQVFFYAAAVALQEIGSLGR
jgi:hypothetical protein